MRIQIIEKLIKLGLSRYESLAYVSLLEVGPATAYETAKNAGLPTSKIYEVLAKLIEQGLALEMHENNRKRYTALEPQDFINKYRGEINRTINKLEKDLNGYKRHTNVSYIWNMDSYGDFIQISKEAINQCQKELLLSLWPQEAEEFSKDLEKAGKKGVYMASVFFGKENFNRGQVFHHPIEDTIYNEKGGRSFTLVADQNMAITATIGITDTFQGAWSRSDGFITLAKDYIKHDIYIMKIVSRFDRELIKTFGTEYKFLRDIFSDMEVSDDNKY
jgi:sugar-specific transcriptional regulator TrmB